VYLSKIISCLNNGYHCQCSSSTLELHNWLLSGITVGWAASPIENCQW